MKSGEMQQNALLAAPGHPPPLNYTPDCHSPLGYAPLVIPLASPLLLAVPP